MNRRQFNKFGLAATAVAVAPVALAQPTSVPSGFELRPAGARGQAEHGWLSSRHSFSFARYYDPNHVGFSDLFVINEDRVAPGGGFGTHPHRDVEIFSYVLEGALEHKDSMGSGAVCRPGDVQFMSAGSGVTHSEFNPLSKEPVHFLQIWVAPAQQGTVPRYVQKHFPRQEKEGKLRLILSEKGYHGSIVIGQDIKVYAGLFSGKQKASLKLEKDRVAYIHLARGTLDVNGVKLQAGDGLKVSTAELALKLSNGENAEVLVFDLRKDGRNPLQG